MKIAVTGKGGVGKSTISAGLARSFSRRGCEVIALDMDPSPNLLSSIGCGEFNDYESVKPLMEMSDLIEERTGAPPEGYGRVFKLNPKVDDIISEYGITCKDKVTLLVLGTIKQGGEGCFCPANALAKRLIDHLTKRIDVLIMDMEAGVEHLGRGTTETVEILLIVVESSLKSIETAKRIKNLAIGMGIEEIITVINKVKSKEIEKNMLTLVSDMGLSHIYSIDYIDAMEEADLSGTTIFDNEKGNNLLRQIDKIAATIVTEHNIC